MRSCKIITGALNGGKSTVISSLIKDDKAPLQGFVSDKDSDGYLLRSLKTGFTRRYLSKSEKFESRLGRWYLDPSCFDVVINELGDINRGRVYLDEVGRWELSGGGFDSALKLLVSHDIDLIITVRDDFLDDVIERYGLDNAQIIKTSQYT